MVDLRNLDKTLPFQAEKALERAQHQGRAAHLQAGDLSPESFLFRKVGVDFGNGDAEDAVIRGAPDRSLAVIGQLGDTVGAEPVFYIDSPDFLSLGIEGNDTIRGRGQEGAVVA